MKTQEEIEQLAEKMFNDIDKPTRSGKDKHSYLVGVQEGYTQCQEDMVKDVKIIDLFISEINKEFPNENWEYLEFIKNRVINSLNKQDNEN